MAMKAVPLRSTSCNTFEAINERWPAGFHEELSLAIPGIDCSPVQRRLHGMRRPHR
jgi:hypothetical protein